MKQETLSHASRCLIVNKCLENALISSVRLGCCVVDVDVVAVAAEAERKMVVVVVVMMNGGWMDGWVNVQYIIIFSTLNLHRR